MIKWIKKKIQARKARKRPMKSAPIRGGGLDAEDLMDVVEDVVDAVVVGAVIADQMSEAERMVEAEPFQPAPEPEPYIAPAPVNNVVESTYSAPEPERTYSAPEPSYDSGSSYDSGGDCGGGDCD